MVAGLRVCPHNCAMVTAAQLYRTFTLLSLATTLVAYGAGAPVFIAVATANGIPAASFPQIVFVCTVLLATGTVLHLVRPPVARAILLGVQFFLNLFLTVIVGPAAWVQAILIVPQIVQLGLITSPRLFMVVATGGLALVFYRLPQTVAWGATIPGPLFHDIVVLIGLSIIVAALVALILFVTERFRRQETLIDNLKTNIVNLTRANYAFQTYASAADEAARREERLKITRDIHDSIGYTLTTLRMMLEAGKDLIANAPLRLEMHLQKALGIIDSGSGEVRTALHQLRGSEPEPRAGIHGLKRLIEFFGETTGITVAVSWGNVPWSLPYRTEAALYRFVQEAMSNALSHGNATQVRIAFRREGGVLVVGVADNGVGADTIIEGIGLRGMRERLRDLGGTIDARSSSVGFLVKARLPLEEDTA